MSSARLHMPIRSASAEHISLWRRWLHRPQSIWARKALFQVHLWTGITIGLYVLAISVSGSAIVFRNEISAHSRRTVVVADSGHRMAVGEITPYVQRAYPAYELFNVYDAQSADEPDVVVLGRREKRIVRLFDPYTGADLGDPYLSVYHAIEWLANLHDNLLAGRSGRFVNGIGSCFVTLLGFTGVVLWWPGIKNWRRSTTISWKARFPRFNWDLHSATGFWFSLFVLVWGISGIYFCLPAAFTPLAGGSFLYWIGRLHIGRFGWITEALWSIFGLIPAVLAVTGALMWWNRVLRKKFRHAASD